MPRAARGSSSSTGGSTQPSLWGDSGGGAPPSRPRNTGTSETQSDPIYGSGGEADSYPKPRPVQPAGPGTEVAGPSTAGITYGAAGEGIKRSAGDRIISTAEGRVPLTETNAPPMPEAPPKAGEPGGPEKPGVFSVDVTSPTGLGESIAKDNASSENMIQGLLSGIFGSNGQGGVPILSDVARAGGSVAQGVFGKDNGSLLGGTPIGDLARAAGGIPGGVGDQLKNVGDTVGGFASILPSINPGAPAAREQLDAMFDATPDSPEKQQTQAKIAADPLGAEHAKYEYLQGWVQSQQAVNPTLFPELQVPSGTFADDISMLMAGTGLFSRPIERGLAGMAKSTGMNRLQEIEAVHNGGTYTGVGGTGVAAGQQGNTDAEELAYQKWKDGTWSQDQALDFLSASGGGFSHDTGLNLAGEVALDPTVWGSLGAGGLSKLGIRGLKLLAEPGTVLRAEGTSSRLNILGRVAEQPNATKIVRALGTHVYTPLQSNALGQAARIGRTIIDPLHAMGGRRVIGEAMVDVGTEASVRMFEEAHGPLAAAQVLNDLKDIDPRLYDMHVLDKATYSMNLTRKALMRQRVANTLVQGLGHELLGVTPGDLIDDVLRNAPKDYTDLVKDEMVRVRQLTWTGAARENLGERMAATYGFKTPGEWTAYLAGKGDDYLSVLHASTYGRATKDFLDAVTDAANELGMQGARSEQLDRAILLNRDSLTDIGAKGILSDIEGAGTLEEQIARVREAQRLYPELAYVQMNPANLQRSLDRFTVYLENRLADGVLPHQLTDIEIKRLPAPIQDFVTNIHDAWSIGFRPEDDKLMGLTRDLEGRYTQGFEPWVDHVAVAKMNYRTTLAQRVNAAGMPIVGSGFGRGLDYMEAGARTLKARVSSSAIQSAATGRFVAAAQKLHGMGEAEAREIINAIQETAGVHKTTVRGLAASDMWEAARAFVPDRLRLTGEVTNRDVLNLVMDAYEGDMRFVGLTQKFTGRAKAAFAARTGSNFAGEFSERLYGQVRFHMNPMFQLQEKIEPWVLNAQRGAVPAFGTKFTETDRQAAAIYERMARTGVNRAAEFDQAEMSAQALIGSDVADELGRLATPSRWAQLKDVKGTKRLNELRTFAHDMGKSVRTIWDQRLPGEWDRMISHYTELAGRSVTDDEAAIKWLAEQGFAEDVRVDSVIRPGSTFSDFRQAINTQEWHVPSNIGEIKGLDLDFMAKGMGFPLKGGGVVSDAAQLRAALLDHGSGLTMDRLADALATHGAHPDYIRRVTNALNFHWDGFWRTVTREYSLTAGEGERLQQLMSESARVRGMTPVDYVSQVFSPMVGGGEGASVKALDSAVSILRSSEGMTEDDLMAQLADVFHHHLDPSAQETLMTAFEKELPSEINDAMVGGKPTVSRDLQATLSQFRGGEATGGGVALPKYATTAEGAQRGRLVSGTEMAALRARGSELLSAADAAPRTPVFAYQTETAAELAGNRAARELSDADLLANPEPVRAAAAAPTGVTDEIGRYTPGERRVFGLDRRQADVPVANEQRVAARRTAQEANAYDRAVDDVFTRVVAGDSEAAWGGATLDPRTGQFLELPKPAAGRVTGEGPLVLDSRGAFANSDIVAPERAPTAERINGLTGKPDSFEHTTLGKADEIIWYGPDGKAHGYVSHTKPVAGADETLAVYVDPEFRRQGVATQLYDQLDAAGVDISQITGKITTEEGAAFTQARAARPRAPLYLLPNKPGTALSVSRETVADPQAFRAAFDEFVADNRVELEKADHYVGVYNNHETGMVEFDVSIATRTERDAEAVQSVATGQTGGAFNVYGGPDAQNVYGPVNTGDWMAGHSQKFGRSILDYVQGAKPTEAFEEVTDPLRGVANVRSVADQYMKSAGLTTPPRRFFPVDPDFGERTARAYESLPSSGVIEAGPPVTAADLPKVTRKLKPTPAGVDEATVKAYQAFVDETIAQYKTIKKSGVTFEPSMSDPYPNSAAMVADVRDNKHLFVYAGAAQHPLLTDGQNVLFRGVHDYFAHAAEGFQFGPRGELNAAIKHSQMYSPEARRAMLTETHGQNSVVNFSKTLTEDGRSIAEVNKATPGAVYAEQKAGLLPQAILDEFGQRFVGSGAGLASNPDVARAVQQFSKWSKQALAQGLMRDDPRYADLLKRVTGIPTDAATPFNQAHQLMVNQVGHAMRQSAEDAFRLQYFARNRTFLERSLNHPFFGIYPASYMWGKILPELVHFVAEEPFGVKTGAALAAATDIKKSIATQLEYDPNFSKKMQELGHSSVFWLLGYMIPSLPWDVGAAAPAWARELAQQGINNQALIDKGEKPKPIDFGRIFGKIEDYVNPLRSGDQLQGPLKEINDALNPKVEADPNAPPTAEDIVRGRKNAQSPKKTVVPVPPPTNTKYAPTPLSAQGFIGTPQMRPGEPAETGDDDYPPWLNEDDVPESDRHYQRGVDTKFGREGFQKGVVDRTMQDIVATSNAGPVRFNPNVKLDPSQVEFVRGMENIGSRQLPTPAGFSPYSGEPGPQLTLEDVFTTLQDTLGSAAQDVTDILSRLL